MGITILKNYVPSTDENVQKTFEDVHIPIFMRGIGLQLNQFEWDLEKSAYKYINNAFTFAQQVRDDNSYVTFYTGKSYAQRITTGDKGNMLNKISVMLNKPSSATGGNLSAIIKSDVDGQPGEILATSSNFGVGGITQGVQKSYTLTFTTPYAMKPKTNYWIELKNTNTASHALQWFCAMTEVDPNLPVMSYDGSAWTSDTTRMMQFGLEGYVVDGTIEIPVQLEPGIDYTNVAIDIESSANTDVFIDILDAKTRDPIYEKLVNKQTISLDVFANPEILFNIKVSRDPSEGIDNTFIKSIGFKGKVNASANKLVERTWRMTNVTMPILESDTLEITTGGLQIKDGRQKHDMFTPYSGEFVSAPTNLDLNWIQPVVLPMDFGIDKFNLPVYCGNATASNYANIYFVVYRENTNVPGTIGEEVFKIKFTDIGSTINTSSTVTINVEIPNPISVKKGEKIFIGFVGKLLAQAFHWKGATNSFPDELGGVCTLNSVAGKSQLYRVYGTYLTGTATMEIKLPGVERQGVVYPLIYKPDGSGVNMRILDVEDGSVIASFTDTEYVSLALYNTRSIGNVKLECSLYRKTDCSSPVVGICYQYDGSYTPVEIVRYKTRKRFSGTVPANFTGVLFEVQGSGEILSGSWQGYKSTNYTPAYNSSQLTIDSLVLNTPQAGATSSSVNETFYVDWQGAFSTTTAPTDLIHLPFKQVLRLECTHRNAQTPCTYDFYVDVEV